MAKYYFEGTVSQISRDGTGLKIDITPNAEYVVSHKEDMGGGRLETVTIAVLQQDNKTNGGIAFKYDNYVTLTMPTPAPCPCGVCFLPFVTYLASGDSLRFELETPKKRGTKTSSAGICTCKIECPKATAFDIIKIAKR